MHRRSVEMYLQFKAGGPTLQVHAPFSPGRAGLLVLERLRKEHQLAGVFDAVATCVVPLEHTALPCSPPDRSITSKMRSWAPGPRRLCPCRGPARTRQAASAGKGHPCNLFEYSVVQITCTCADRSSGVPGQSLRNLHSFTLPHCPHTCHIKLTGHSGPLAPRPPPPCRPPTWMWQLSVAALAGWRRPRPSSQPGGEPLLLRRRLPCCGGNAGPAGGYCLDWPAAALCSNSLHSFFSATGRLQARSAGGGV